MTITNGYCTLAELKSEQGVSDSTDDTRLEISIEAASRQIDSFCGRRFWQDSTVKIREFRADDSTCVYVDDISTTTGLVVKVDAADNGFVSDSTTLTITTDFVLEPLNAADESPVWPYTKIRLTSGAAAYFPCGIRPGVQVTAQFGWPAVPMDVKKACLVQATQLFRAGDAVFGAVSFGLEGGAMRVPPLNPMAAALLQRYVKEL